MTDNSFGERLAKLRESKGWLQRDVAFRMSVKANTISNWEKGISRPNLDQICQLCQVLTVTSDHLLGLDKTAMEQTLNLREQALIRCFRNSSDSMRNAIHTMLSQIDYMNRDVFEMGMTLTCAEEFIETVDMQEEWETEKKEKLPFYAEEDDQ